MHIRPWQAIDLPVAGDIQAICNTTDALVRWMNKDIHKHWATYRKTSAWFLKAKVLVPGAVAFVAETDASDYPPEEAHKAPEVVGFAVWTRMGTSPTAQEWQKANNTWSRKFERTLVGLEERYRSFFPSVQCTYNVENLNRIISILRMAWDPEIFAEAWELNLLFVLPKWQRKGIGRMLLQWGFDNAVKEEVPVVIGSSARGAAAYKAAGCKSIGPIGFQEYFDEKEYGGEEYQFFVWEPEAQKGTWFERAKAKRDEATKAASNLPEQITTLDPGTS